jgi:Secretion system C-terminal sorting domain
MFMRVNYLQYLLFFISIVGNAQQNVFIGNSNMANEPSIAINPNNTNQLVAASNISNYYTSNDAGLTWTEGQLDSSFGVWGDPVIIADNQNNFYFFHLSNPAMSGTPGNWIDRIVCQKTSNLGTSWTDGSYTGLNGTKKQDKHWAIFDNNNNNIYAAWTQFDAYGTADPTKKSIIRFSKSSDFGSTWSTPLKLNNVDGNCVDESDTVEGCVPAIGPNGQIYTSWSGPAGIVFKKSLDQGASWSTNETTISAISRWAYSVPGLDRTNGQPVTVCDVAPSSPHNGTIYINWSDQRNGFNDTDIFLSKSTDQGTTWTAPLRVNNDAPGKHQFLSWMTIDQTTGYIYIVFYDRRNYNDNQTDVYLAYSTNGGTSFTNTKISTTPFIPVDSVFFGDYTNITAHNGVIRPIWARMDSGVTSVYTAIINQTSLANKEYDLDDNNESEITNYPNPASASEVSFFSFKLYKESPITIKIYDLSGKEIMTFIDNKTYGFGKHIEKMKSSLLPSGEYIYTIKSDYYLKSKKMIIK